MVRHTLDLDDGTQLRFIDPRKFGHLWLVDDFSEAAPAMGPEPLSPGFDAAALSAALGHRAAPIKALLLEQSVIAGWATFTPTMPCTGPGFTPNAQRPA